MAQSDWKYLKQTIVLPPDDGLDAAIVGSQRWMTHWQLYRKTLVNLREEGEIVIKMTTKEYLEGKPFYHHGKLWP